LELRPDPVPYTDGFAEVPVDKGFLLFSKKKHAKGFL